MRSASVYEVNRPRGKSQLQSPERLAQRVREAVVQHHEFRQVADVHRAVRGLAIRTALWCYAQVEPSEARREVLNAIESKRKDLGIGPLSPVEAFDPELVRTVCANFPEASPTDWLFAAIALHGWSSWEIARLDPAGKVVFETNLSRANDLGLFYTPADLARSMTADAVELYGKRSPSQGSALPKIVDPAAGAGAFLLAAAEILANRSNRQHCLPMLRGSDVDLAAVTLGNLILQLWSNSSDSVTVLIHADGLLGIGGQPPAEVIGAWKEILAAHDLDRSFGTADWGQALRPTETVADIVLMNPPYGRLKALVSDYSTNESKHDAAALDGFHDNRRQAFATLTEFFRANPVFSDACRGELDWQRLFLAAALRLVGSKGVIHCVLPATLLTDTTTAKLRQRLIQSRSIAAIHYFAEGAGLFRTVNQGIITLLVGSATGTSLEFFVEKAPGRDASCSILQVADLEALHHCIPISSQDLPRAVKICAGLRAFPELGEVSQLRNRRGEFDLTLSKRFLSSESERLLVRGDYVERFQLRDLLQCEGAGVDASGFKTQASEKRQAAWAHPRLVGRQVSYLHKKRRLSFHLAPAGALVANSCNYIASQDLVSWPLHHLLGLFNSSLLEWRFRLTNSNNHVSNYELDGLPVVPASSGRVAECARRLEQAYATREFGVSKNPASEQTLEAELDAEVFSLFKIDRRDATFILSELGCSDQHRAIVMEKMQDA